MAVRVIYLVRHGQYHILQPKKTAEDDCAPSDIDLDGGLTEIGIEQATLTAQRLKDLPINAIFTSTLPRAIQTGEIIAREFPSIRSQQDDLLRECLPGLTPRLSVRFTLRSLDLANRAVEGRLQADDVFERYFRYSFRDDRREVIVCHGNLIRYLVTRALGAPPELWTNFDIRNCGISEIHIRPEGPLVLAHSDVGHLPVRLHTSL